MCKAVLLLTCLFCSRFGAIPGGRVPVEDAENGDLGERSADEATHADEALPNDGYSSLLARSSAVAEGDAGQLPNWRPADFVAKLTSQHGPNPWSKLLTFQIDQQKNPVKLCQKVLLMREKAAMINEALACDNTAACLGPDGSGRVAGALAEQYLAKTLSGEDYVSQCSDAIPAEKEWVGFHTGQCMHKIKGERMWWDAKREYVEYFYDQIGKWGQKYGDSNKYVISYQWCLSADKHAVFDKGASIRCADEAGEAVEGKCNDIEKYASHIETLTEEDFRYENNAYKGVGMKGRYGDLTWEELEIPRSD